MNELESCIERLFYRWQFARRQGKNDFINKKLKGASRITQTESSTKILRNLPI
jgi:hypothetical protein